ncbi:hypothetical protein [Acinetobacter terrae]|uniref:Uncharacterized protein n=1 Tax=Acinetobacter terrae TaxID=2731247 RepID=A0ABX1V5F1_9GAMM|nr:hypothetical protein [Acinetobacter terrae]NNH88205.1 hypothetical protein [Acinetobacter terrae]
MILKTTVASIVPDSSEIESWPQFKRISSIKVIPQEIVFDAEKWLYGRKSAYPMVDCIPAIPTNGFWKKFKFHPSCNGTLLHDKDILILNSNGEYSVKSKNEPVINSDEAKYLKTYFEIASYGP